MLYSMRRSCTKNNCRKGSMNRSKKTMWFWMRLLKKIPLVPNSQQQKVILQNLVSVRHSTQLSRPPKRFSPSLYSILLTDSIELEEYKEAIQVDAIQQWKLGMKEEIESLLKNKTWDLVPLPKGKRALPNKWVYRLKEEDGGKKRYKARLVVKGFAQKKGIDFDEILSPIVKMTSIRTVLSVVVVDDLHLEQLDVKTNFSMEIWRRKFTCNNQRDMISRVRRIQCVG